MDRAMYWMQEQPTPQTSAAASSATARQPNMSSIPTPPTPPPMPTSFKQLAKNALRQARLEKYKKAHAVQRAPVNPPPLPIGLLQFAGKGMSAFQTAVRAAVQQKELDQKLKDRREQVEVNEKIPDAPVPNKVKCSLGDKQKEEKCKKIPEPPVEPPPMSIYFRNQNRFRLAICGVIAARRFKKALHKRRIVVDAYVEQPPCEGPIVKNQLTIPFLPADQKEQGQGLAVMEESAFKDAMHVSLGKLLQKQSSLLENPSTSHFEQIREFLHELRSNDLLVDVVVTVDSCSFNAHAVILASHSNVFKTYLLEGWRNKKTLPQRVFLDCAITSNAFQIILDFMYTGELAVTDRNVVELLTAAVCLRMPSVEKKCRTLLRALGPESLLLVCNTAESHGLKDLIQTISQIIAKEFLAVVMTRGFLLLPLERLCRLLSRDDLAVTTEIQVAEAGIRWIDHIPAQRYVHTERVMKCIRFPLMSIEELVTMVGRTEYIRKNPEVQHMIMKAHWYVTCKSVNEPCLLVPAPSSRFSVRENTTRNKATNFTTTLVLSPLVDNNPTPGGAIHYPAAPAGRTISPANANQSSSGGTTCPCPRAAQTATTAQVTSVNGEVVGHANIVILHANNQEYKMTEEHHETDNRINSASQDIPKEKSINRTDTSKIKESPKAKVISGVSDGTRGVDHREEYITVQQPLKLAPETRQAVYVLGTKAAKESKGAKSVILELDLAQNKWHKMQTLPAARQYSSAACLNSAIYVSGGCEPEKNKGVRLCPSNDVFRLDLTKMTWSEVKPLQTERCHHAFIAMYGMLFAIGGQDAKQQILSSVECYNPVTNTWTYVSPMNAARLGAAVVAFQEHILVAGGFGGYPSPGKIPTMIGSMEVFSPEEKCWTWLQPMRRPRCYPSLTCCQGKLYLGGGLSLALEHPEHYESLDTMEMYNTETDSWTNKCRFHLPRHGAATFSLNGRIYFVGGNSTKAETCLKSVMCYNISTDSWDNCVTDLPFTLLGPVSVLCPNTASS